MTILDARPALARFELHASATERFRRQHHELQELAMEILGRLTPATLATEAADVRRRLAQFAGKLAIHARMENDALYPRLFRETDVAVREGATRLYREVGDVYAAFEGFLGAWPSAVEIAADPAEFCRQAMRVFRLLGKRMIREETELYPMVDALV